MSGAAGQRFYARTVPTHLRQVVAVARVNIYLGHIRFDTNLVPLSGRCRIGRAISDYVLFSEGTTGLDHVLSCLSIATSMEVKSTG